MLSQLGNLLGSFWFMSFPLKKPKRDSFIMIGITTISSMLFITGKWLGAEKYVLFCLFIFIAGMMKISAYCSYLVLVDTLTLEEDSFLINLWSGLTSVGDIVAIVLYNWIVEQNSCDWSVYLTVMSLILFFFALLYQLCLNEV